MYQVAKVLGYIILGVAVVVAVVCSASVKATTITISEPVAVMAPYPENVSEMSQAEFYDWAVARNAKARAGWAHAYKAAGPKYTYGSERLTTVEASSYNTGSSTRTGFGVSTGPGQRSYSSRVRKRVLPRQWNNPDFRHPGPLTIINPYVKPR